MARRKRATLRTQPTNLVSVDMASVAFQSAREEILLRMKQGLTITLAYLAGTFTLIAAAVTAGQGTPPDLDTQFYLSCVPPLASLIVAINVSAHIKAIEQLAEFIRDQLNNFMITAGTWAPTWDVHTRQGGDSGRAVDSSVERSKTRRRLFGNLATIHVPSFASLAVAAYHLPGGQPLQYLCVPWFDRLKLSVFVISAVIWLIGVIITYTSFGVRNSKKAPKPRIPDEHKSLWPSNQNKVSLTVEIPDDLYLKISEIATTDGTTTEKMIEDALLEIAKQANKGEQGAKNRRGETA